LIATVSESQTVRRLDQELKNMKKPELFIALIWFVIALIIFIFGSGLRVIYSGGFFIMLGIVTLISARRKAN
jgi:hypothetical protein